jgi:hypothetical protein
LAQSVRHFFLDAFIVVNGDDFVQRFRSWFNCMETTSTVVIVVHALDVFDFWGRAIAALVGFSFLDQTLKSLTLMLMLLASALPFHFTFSFGIFSVLFRHTSQDVCPCWLCSTS